MSAEEYQFLKENGFSDQQIMADPEVPDDVRSFAASLNQPSQPWSKERVAELANVLGQGATLGYGDEAAAGIRSGLGYLDRLVGDDPSYGTYDQELGAIRGELARAKKRNPYSSMALEIAGAAPLAAMIPSTSEAMAIKAGPEILKGTLEAGGKGLLKRMIYAGGSAATLGGTYGFGSGEGGYDPRLENAGNTALASALLGALTQGGVEGVGKAYNNMTGWWANRAANKATAASEPVKAALRVAERDPKGSMLRKPAEEITKIDNNSKGVIEVIQSRAGDDTIERAVGDQLGVGRSKAPEVTALRKFYQQDFDDIVETGVLQKASTVKEATAMARTGTADVGQAIDDTVMELEKVIEPYNSTKTGAPVRESQMKGIITTKHLSSSITKLKTRINQLRQTGLLKGKAGAIEETMKSIENDIAPQEIKIMGKKAVTSNSPDTVISYTSPRKAINIYQNLNELRRDILKEFDSVNVARAEKGNHPNLGKLEASLEAVQEMQRGLAQAIKKMISGLNEEGITKIDPEAFIKMNDQYGAYKTLGNLGEDFAADLQRSTSVGADKGVVAESSAKLPPHGGWSGLWHLIRENWDAFKGNPTPQTKEALRLERRSPNAMSNIQDLLYLNKNPIQYADPKDYQPALARALAGIPQQRGPGLEQLVTRPGATFIQE